MKDIDSDSESDELLSSDEDTDINEIRNLNRNDIIKIQLDTISKIINMFPKLLEKHKNDIISNIIGNSEKKENCVLTKIEVNGNTYYKFINKSILLDNNCNTVGIYYKIKNTYKYFVFSETEKKFNKLKVRSKTVYD